MKREMREKQNLVRLALSACLVQILIILLKLII